MAGESEHTSTVGHAQFGHGTLSSPLLRFGRHLGPSSIALGIVEEAESRHPSVRCIRRRLASKARERGYWRDQIAPHSFRPSGVNFPFETPINSVPHCGCLALSTHPAPPTAPCSLAHFQPLSRATQISSLFHPSSLLLINHLQNGRPPDRFRLVRHWRELRLPPPPGRLHRADQARRCAAGAQ